MSTNIIGVNKSIYLNPSPTLTETIDKDDEYFHYVDLHNFDREGYDLIPIEVQYHSANQVLLNDINIVAKENGQQPVLAVLQPWFHHTKPHLNIFIDHSYILHRFNYGGAALEQLQYFRKARPELQKLIQCKQKWGVDLCIDYIDNKQLHELCHIEWDFYSVVECREFMLKLEGRLLTLNWDWFVEQVKKIDSVNWRPEECINVSDLKAKLLNIHKASRILKSL